VGKCEQAEGSAYYWLPRGESFDFFSKAERRRVHNFVRKGKYHHHIKALMRRRQRRAEKRDPANAPPWLGYRGYEF
jgi:hypothetical protein